MISAAELASMRATVESTFTHTYTRTPRVATADDPSTSQTNEGEDSWGGQVFSPAAPQHGRPCRYRDQSTAVATPNGIQSINVPVLWVPSTDLLNLGDQVSNVRDAHGTVLLAGPVEVEDTSNSGLLAGGTLHIEVTLRQPLNV